MINQTKGIKFNGNGYKQIPLEQPFTKPKDFQKVDLDRKYTPIWALPENLPITKIIDEDKETETRYLGK